VTETRAWVNDLDRIAAWKHGCRESNARRNVDRKSSALTTNYHDNEEHAGIATGTPPETIFGCPTATSRMRFNPLMIDLLINRRAAVLSLYLTRRWWFSRRHLMHERSNCFYCCCCCCNCRDETAVGTRIHCAVLCARPIVSVLWTIQLIYEKWQHFGTAAQETRYKLSGQPSVAISKNHLCLVRMKQSLTDLGNSNIATETVTETSRDSTWCTHSYLLSGVDQPECTTCQCPLTFKHILVECTDFNDTRTKYFVTSSLEK